MENLYDNYWNVEREFYIGLSVDKQIVWLSRFGYYLCMDIRGDLYDYRQENVLNKKKLDNMNDILLQIFGKISSKVRKADNFPDIDFFEMLKEKCVQANYDITGFVKDIKPRLDLMDE